MTQESANLQPLEPPAEVPEIQRGNWLALSPGDPVAEHINQTLWGLPRPPVAWESARLSSAAYIYRETSTGWAVVAKFYAVKAGSSAQKYASREFDCIRQIRDLGLAGHKARAVDAVALWRGVLFLEYVAGLTLENIQDNLRTEYHDTRTDIKKTRRRLRSLDRAEVLIYEDGEVTGRDDIYDAVGSDLPQIG